MAFRFPKPSEGGDFTPVPPGNWPARLYSLIDLGTQQVVFEGNPPQDKRQVRLAWELHDEDCVMKSGPKAGQPMMIARTFTWSMNEKASLRLLLEAWRGSTYTEAEILNFDPRNLVGQPCLLSVVQRQRGDKTYSNIQTATRPVKGLTVPPLINKPIYVVLDKDDFDREAFAALPDRIKETIMDSPEYQRLAAGGGGGNEHDASDYKQEEEIPF